MTTQNEVPEIRVGEIDLGIVDLFNNSAKWMQWGLEGLAVLLIAYTLPHNAHAFGMERIIDFRTLGLLVIELTFALAVLHFTRGWLADDQHRTAALSTITLAATILVCNSALSQLLYLLEDPNFHRTSTLLMIVDGYQMFILPATPILAVLLATWLVGAHPAVRGVGEMFVHISKMADMTRKSDMKQEEALYIQTSANTDREAAKGLLSAEKIKNDTLRYQAEADFARRTQKAMLRGRESQRNEILKSEEWMQLTNVAEKQALIDQLDEMYPNLAIRNFIDPNGDMINPVELRATLDEVLDSRQFLLEEVNRLKAELAAAPQPIPAEEEEPYLNGHAAD